MSLSFCSKDMRCAAEMEKDRAKPLGCRMSSSAPLEAAHPNSKDTGFPIRAFALKGRILVETTRLREM